MRRFPRLRLADRTIGLVAEPSCSPAPSSLPSQHRLHCRQHLIERFLPARLVTPARLREVGLAAAATASDARDPVHEIAGFDAALDEIVGDHRQEDDLVVDLGREHGYTGTNL